MEKTRDKIIQKEKVVVLGVTSQMQEFLNFIRKQGVIGLAVGFLLGGAVSKLVTALVNDIINPLLGIVLGVASGLKTATVKVGPATLLWGDFVSNLIDFIVIASVIYFGFKLLKIDQWDRKEVK